jgi:hypothetical protein
MKKQLDSSLNLKSGASTAWSMSCKSPASDSSARGVVAPAVPAWKKYCEDRLKQFASAR